jgi:hypothetical protein
VPGAFGAVLVDRDGEAVDYAGRADPYDLKLAGAHWQIVLRELRALAEAHPRAVGTPRSIVVRGGRRSFIAHALPDDYALILLLSRRAGFSAATCAFAVCERALAAEAGWRPDALSPPWFALQVVAGRGGRPARIREGIDEYPIEVLGKVTGLASHEEAWRVRLEHGAELTLAREPGGHWYADEAPGFVPTSTGPPPRLVAESRQKPR